MYIDNKAVEKGNLLEDIESELYRELDKTSNPARARTIMEVIAASHIPTTADGMSSGIEIDKDTVARLSRTSSPCVAAYRNQLRRWCVSPDKWPLLPNREWAMDAFSQRNTIEDHQMIDDEESDEWDCY